MILRLGVMRGIKQAKILLNAKQKSLLVASFLPNFSSGRSHFSLKFEPRLSPAYNHALIHYIKQFPFFYLFLIPYLPFKSYIMLSLRSF